MLVACQSNTNCFFRVPLLYLIISPSPYSYSSIDLLSRDWKNYFIQSDPCWLCLTLYTISATNCEHRKFAPPPGGSPPGKYIPGDFPTRRRSCAVCSVRDKGIYKHGYRCEATQRRLIWHEHVLQVAWTKFRDCQFCLFWGGAPTECLCRLLAFSAEY